MDDESGLSLFEYGTGSRAFSGEVRGSSLAFDDEKIVANGGLGISCTVARVGIMYLPGHMCNLCFPTLE